MRRQTHEPLQYMTSARTVRRSALSAIVLVFCVSACGGGDKGADETDLTASQVCASAFDASAAKSLQRMGDTSNFTELPSSDDSRQSNKFSRENAASTVHKDQTQRNQCVVFKAGDKSSHPLIGIDFSASKYVPKRRLRNRAGTPEKPSMPSAPMLKPAVPAAPCSTSNVLPKIPRRQATPLLTSGQVSPVRRDRFPQRQPAET